MMVSGSTETPQVQHGLSLQVLLFILHNTDPPDHAITGFSSYHNDFITRGMMSSGNKTWGSPARMSWPLREQSHALPRSPPGDTATYTTCSSLQTPSEDILSLAPGSVGTTGSPDKVFWINRLFSLQPFLRLSHSYSVVSQQMWKFLRGEGWTRVNMAHSPLTKTMSFPSPSPKVSVAWLFTYWI